MIYEVTFQVRVTEMVKGEWWYQTLLGREPDFVPHEGFAEWELISRCWLQVAVGIPAKSSGPLRLGVVNIEAERERLVKELNIAHFKIYERPEVPVKWATFSDPWGNHIGLFEYLSEAEKDRKMNEY
ncbi:VOC family protein [Cytobacillus solani]|uniref:Ornithine monooxygenase n=1 Tax=Cytobacillus solani TaxID=1637975 RepID=A0A0Q3VKR7_9BACI|nr:ornithine monooxygenase [Cytobacillus solani]KOP72122.1 ornithine monooxygenase [Bacillus sp. FJAT-21945]KQL22066.1 ornithine monooxygenase [Cytobacillus solani]USK57669.1 VOC family protein [Cytobacillus solani]